MKTNPWRRLATIVATAGLLGSLGVVGAVAPVLAVDSCTGAGFALNPGVDCTVTGAHVLSGAVTFNETLHMTTGSSFDTSAAATTITVDPGSVIMDVGSAITGGGQNIAVNVPHGDMTMHGTPLGPGSTDKCGYPNTPNPALGAQITSNPSTLQVTTTITITIGNYPNNVTPQGSFTMERCSLLDVSNHSTGGSKGPAGTVNIKAGHDADIDGQVLSESTLTGVGANQPPGGGPITVQTGCQLIVSSTGVISSKGADPGADLVHLEGCNVTIDGLVQSTGPGHAIPNNPANHCATNGPNGDHSGKPANSTGCIEIIGQNITISNTGEVNADISSAISGGPNGTSWIDIFSYDNTTIVGRTGTGTFAVHADSYIGTDVTTNTVTVKAGHDTSSLGTFTGGGNILSATNQANGSDGGDIVVQASGAVNLDTGTVVAAGDNSGGINPPCDSGSGACGSGGTINVRSFQSLITWQNGVGNVNPDLGVSPPAGAVGLIACTTVNTTGTNFDNATPTVQATIYTDSAGVPHALGNQDCTTLLPSVPAYVSAAFNVGEPIWEACVPGKLDSSTVTVIHGGPGASDTTAAPAITQAPLGSTVHDMATVTGSGPTPTGTVAFTWYTNKTCTEPGVSAGAAVALDGTGKAHPSSDETVPATGGSFKAVYSGDSVYNGSTGACEPLSVQSQVLESSTSTVIHAGAGASDTTAAPAITSAAIGSTVHDMATVTGSGPVPTGTVAFTWYTNTTCVGTGVSAGSAVALDGTGKAHPSSDETVPATGGSFKAVYSGDSVYNGSTGACEPLDATKLDSSTSTVIHAGPGASDTTAAAGITSAAIGSTVHDMATVTGSGPVPTGTVAFTWYTNTTCVGTGVSAGSAVALDGTGKAHPSSDETVTVGGDSFKAVYSGDSVYNGSTGACEPLDASKLTSSTSTVIHAGAGASDTTAAAGITSAAIGSTVHDMATVTGSGPVPTGTVAFTWYTNTTCGGTGVSAGSAVALDATGKAHPSSDEIVPATGGSFKAVYSGDSVYNGSTGACEPLNASKLASSTSTTIHAGAGASDTTAAAGITSAPIGSTVHDMATVTGSGPVPTGTVAFTWYTNKTCDGTGVSAGPAVALDATGKAHPSGDETVTVGGDSFKAVYSGDSVYNGSTGACEPLNATKLNSSTSTTIHAGAGASDTTAAAGITSAPIGSTVHDLASVTGSGPTPTGTVAFTWYTNKTCAGTGVSAGSAVALDATGKAHPSSDEVVTATGGSFKAVYSGDTVYNGSTGSCEPLDATKLNSSLVTVIHSGAGASDTPATGIVVTSAAVGSTVHDMATVTGTAAGGTPTGNVTFKWYTTQNCTGTSATKGTITLDASGIAHPSTDVVVPAGGGSFQATYNGSTIYNTSTGACEPLTASSAIFGLTPGFWGNKNGNAAITAGGFLPQTVGSGARTTIVTTLDQSNTLMKVSGCGDTWTIQCSAGFSQDLHSNTFEQLARQTLALKYNMLSKGGGFSGQTLAAMGVTITPALTALGFTGSSTVTDVWTKGQALIGASGPGGTTTQTQASAIIDLMTFIDSV